MSSRQDDRERKILGSLITVVREWGAPTAHGEVAERVKVDVPNGEIRMIFMLANRPPMRPVDIADHLAITRPAVSKSLQALREAGFITHLPAPEDARSFYVTLTEEGHEAHQRIVAAGVGLIRSVGEDFSESELDAISRFIQRFAQRVGGDGPIVI